MALAGVNSQNVTEFPVANPEWGAKRICQNCGTKFYDLERVPIVCPKCRAESDPEASLSTRRTFRATVAARKPEPAPARHVEDPLDIEDAGALGDEDKVAEADDVENDGLIEDLSDLDDDDIADVIETDDAEDR